MKTMWVEKYRPNKLSKIINEDIKQLLSNSTTLNNFPHLLFHGSAGTGKTTTALAICEHIYKHNTKIIKERVIELNASDERGIKVVREKIKLFANQAMNSYDNIPNFKIIILDEADAMTNDSQFALRRIIEQYSCSTRFILICNYVTKIIPPLSSRCTKFIFRGVTNEKVCKLLTHIIKKEGYPVDNYTNNILKLIYYFAAGDIRKAINILQRSYYIATLKKVPLSEKILLETIDKIPSLIIKDLMQLLLSNQNIYTQLFNKIKFILNSGYMISDLLNAITNYIIIDKNIKEDHRAIILLKISNIIYIISIGAGEYIHILSICSFINYIINH